LQRLRETIMGNWSDKVVVVAGGSRGLGRELARKFHRCGALLTVLGRNADDVQAAIDELNRQRPDSATGISVDLGDEQDRKRVVREVLDRQSRVDVWINAVGQSIRTDFRQAKMTDYRRLMEQNFFVSVGCSLEILPSLEESHGHLINIGSLAAKTAWPFVAPYVTSKHALAGFAHQLRIEGPDNVHYLFVCPGPIRSERPVERYAEQTGGLPDTARQPGAGAPVRAIDAASLTDKIVAACDKRSPELVVPTKSRLLFSILQLWPSVGDRLIRRYCR
jgi:short-subunit dehydrogenase